LLDHTPLVTLALRRFDTAVGKHDAARLRSSAGGAASAWLTAMPTAPATTLSPYAFKAAGRLRLGYGLDTRVALRPCLCRAGEAASADHAMVCDACKKQRTFRHDILASAWRRVLCNAGIAACMEPRYGALVGDIARAAAVGLHRGDILAVIDGSMSALDIVVSHPGASTYVSAAARAAGATAKVAERGKVRDWRRIGGHESGYDFVPLATETYGRLGVQAARFLKEVADYAARKGVSKSAFTRMAHTELSCALVKGMALVWNAGMFATARAAGRGFQEGQDVPVADTVLE
jgi:hypothetical protein